jgi:gas vesicle protein
VLIFDYSEDSVIIFARLTLNLFRGKVIMVKEKDELSVSTKLTYFLVGAGIGAIVALLFAPKSGRELREDIATATKKGLEKGKEATAQLQEKVGEYYEITKEKAEELAERAEELAEKTKEKAEELAEKAKEKASEIADKAKETAAKATNPISAAIEAGKQAYIEEKRKTESSMITEERPVYPVKEKKSKS